MKYNFSITKTTKPKEKPNPDTLEFGTIFSDHMFLMNYDSVKGWNNGRIVPYGPLSLDPATSVLHYGQEMFEGLKAYRGKNGDVQLFRPSKNAERANKTTQRLCMPQMEVELYVEAVKALVSIDRDWIPEKEGTSLYIRPFMIASEAFLGVRASREYIFAIILSPVGPYYEGGLAPTKIFVEDEYVRSVSGGTGEAKIGGNYAACLKSQEKASDLDYSQVLWLDGIEKKYVEEIGTSNAFFVIDGEVITPPLRGTILAGITRDSVIEILKSWDVKIKEDPIAIEEVYKAASTGRLTEIFASGTAAVISPVGQIRWKDKIIEVNNGEIGELSQRLYDEITGIQSGRLPDGFNWIVKL